MDCLSRVKTLPSYGRSFNFPHFFFDTSFSSSTKSHQFFQRPEKSSKKFFPLDYASCYLRKFESGIGFRFPERGRGAGGIPFPARFQNFFAFFKKIRQDSARSAEKPDFLRHLSAESSEIGQKMLRKTVDKKKRRRQPWGCLRLFEIMEYQM